MSAPRIADQGPSEANMGYRHRPQLDGKSHKQNSPIRSRRPPDVRRPGPLAEQNRLSDVYLLRDLDGIVDFDAQIAHGALDLRMPKQELNGAQIAGAAVDQDRLRAPQ